MLTISEFSRNDHHHPCKIERARIKRIKQKQHKTAAYIKKCALNIIYLCAGNQYETFENNENQKDQQPMIVSIEITRRTTNGTNKEKRKKTQYTHPI